MNSIVIKENCITVDISLSGLEQELSKKRPNIKKIWKIVSVLKQVNTSTKELLDNQVLIKEFVNESGIKIECYAKKQ